MAAPEALPRWRSVLVVVAHPDDESFGLGAVIDSLVSRGASVTVLCLTHGEASTLHGSTADLATLRESELRTAAAALGCVATVLRDHPDGALGEVEASVLVEDVAAVARRSESE
ncbi:MAG TPA: PIG-L deacetylase family protein, partial [Cellulomonadaceae bacterium]|nr:PIG-L deacetylase family protein [Cellulomonadaceae bacterium]